ncbi:MAG: hypothetical protein K2H72_02660 [Muribaculaceae bacterium]|nr:hypothetical protein [Muribaculaceae bacterium]
MIRKLIISLACMAALVTGFSASAAKKTESPGRLAKKQIEIFLKTHNSSPEEALTAMETAIEYASKADHYDLTNNDRALIYYLADHQYHKVKGEHNTKWLTLTAYYGAHPNSKITDYGIALATADARIKVSRLHKMEEKGVDLANAKLILDNLKTSDAGAYPNKALSAIGFEVSPQALERLYSVFEEEAANTTPEEWAAAAFQAINHPDRPVHKDRNDEFAIDLCACTCVKLARAAGSPDAEAFEGDLLSSGKFPKYYPRDEAKARQAFRNAAEKGSLWGAVKTALYLIDEKKWKEAYDMVASHQENPDFNWQGGNYVLARVYEEGAIDGKSWKDAYPLYAASASKNRFLSIIKDSQKRSEDLQNRILAEETDELVAKSGGIKKMTPKELATVARRYQRLNRTEDAMKFWKEAADKGHAQACNSYAMLWCKSHDYRKDEGMKDIVGYFRKGADLGYYPAIANLIVVSLYGYGCDPDHDKAFSLFDQLMDNKDSESLDDFVAGEEFLYTISGTKYSSKAILNGDHLKKAVAEHKDPAYLTMFGKARHRDSRPAVWKYYLKRAADMNHQPAKDFLHEAGVEGYWTLL